MKFADLFTHFHDFWSQIRVVILVTPKQELHRTSATFCAVNCFRFNFKVQWENGVWTKFAFCIVNFCSCACNSSSVLSDFWFFWSGCLWNGFPCPFLVLSRSSYFFSQWAVKIVGQKLSCYVFFSLRRIQICFALSYFTACSKFRMK